MFLAEHAAAPPPYHPPPSVGPELMSGAYAAGRAAAGLPTPGIHCSSCRAAYVADGDGDSIDTESEDGEPVDFAEPMGSVITPDGKIDVQEVTSQFLLARRRFRTVTGKQPRRHRYKGRGKGQRKGKGRGRFRRKSGWSFLTDDGDIPLCEPCAGPPDDTSIMIWFNGKLARRNPLGADKKPMLCDFCGSPHHLWRRCDAQGS